MARIIRPNGEILEPDSVLDETDSVDDMVTDHPVETGARPTDNIQLMPHQFSWRILITATPNGSTEASRTGVTAGVLGQARIDAALVFLESARGEILTAETTRNGTLGSLALAGFSYSVTLAQKAEITVRFKPIVTAETQFVRIPPAQPVASEQTGAPDGQDAGTQLGKPFGPEPFESWASQLFGGSDSVNSGLGAVGI